MIYFILTNASDIFMALFHGSGGVLIKLLVIFDKFFCDFYSHPSWPYLLARFVTVLFGVATIFVVFKIGERIKGRTTGLVAALIMAVVPLHITYSRYALADVPMVFFISCALLYSLKITEDSKNLNNLKGATCVGIAIANKFNGAFAIICLFVAICSSKKNFLLKIMSLFICIGIVLLAFCFFCPYLLVTPTIFVKEIAFNIIGKGALPFTISNILTAIKSIADGFSILPCILSVVGMYFFIKEKKQNSLVVLLPLALYLFIFTAFKGRYDRHALPMYPFLSVLASYGFLGFANYFHNSKRQVLILTFLAFILLPTMLSNFYSIQELYHSDPRFEAKCWIEANVKSDSKIIVQDFIVPLNMNAESIQEKLILLNNVTYLKNVKAKQKHMDGYPVEVLSDVAINSEKVMERRLKFLLQTYSYKKLNPSYMIYEATDGLYVLGITTEKMKELAIQKKVDFVLTTKAFPELGEPFHEWSGIYLYKIF